MNKLFWLLVALCAVSVLTSCEETSGENEYANWKERNQHIIDSIAAVAEENVDGNWRIYKSFSLPADDPNDLGTMKDVNNYVYCHIDQVGSGTVSPIYTDSIRTNYRVWYACPIGGQSVVIDQSFKGALDPTIIVPYKSTGNNMITGWNTAVEYMHVGDIWTVYIPYTLGYGSDGYNGVKGYSTLKYWINLVGIYPTGTLVPDWQ